MPEPISNSAIVAGGSAAGVGLFAWLGRLLLKREVQRMDDTFNAHAARLGVLEKDHIGRDDFDRLFDRLEHKVDALHTRIDQVLGLPPRQ